MSDTADATAEDGAARQTVQGLAYVCAHLDEISTALAGDPTAEEGVKALGRLRAALHDNTDITGPLGDIHHALLRAGDALGVYGHVRGLRSLSLTGFDQSGPLEIVYRCPAGRCPRTVPGPAKTPPQCRVADQALRWGQL